MSSFFERLAQQKATSTAPSAPPAPAEAPAATSGSKIDLSKRAPGLINLHKTAGISLAKNNLTGVKAAVYLVLDHSGSMGSYYRDGTVQDFTERVLAAAVHFDDDGSIPVVLFDSYAREAEDVTVDNYQGAVARMKEAAGHMGTTSYSAAMQAVVAHYQASGSTEPALVVFETDGRPDNRREAERMICESASLPIFWQFVGFGGDDRSPEFDFLRKLDELSVPRKRVIDNAGFFAVGHDPRGMSPEVLYDSLMKEFPTWLAVARRQGIIH